MTDWLDGIKEDIPDVNFPDIGASSVREDEPPAFDYSNAAHSSSHKLQDATIRQIDSNTSMKEKYAGKAYDLVEYALWGLVLLLVTSGFAKGFLGVELWSDKVIVATITGLTVSVVAAFLSVVKGLFSSK